MYRVSFASIVLFQIAGLTAAQATPGLPSERPTPQKQPGKPVNPKLACVKDAVTEHKPLLTSAECAKGTNQPNGAACRWGNECLNGLCVENGSGGGACAAGLSGTVACTQVMGPGDATAVWVGGVTSLGCAGRPGNDLFKLCTALPKATAKPACANGSLTGHSCALDQACTTTEMCRDDLYCVKAYPNVVGKCVRTASNTCAANTELGTISATDPTSLCVPKDLFCH